MRRVFGMATAGLLIFAGWAQAQVLTSVPENAIVFVKVKNLQDVSKKMGVLFQQWGVAQAQPMLADPLAAFQGLANIEQGLNRDGEAGVMYFNPMSVDQQEGGQPYVILLPVSDYAAFTKNFADAETEGELTHITLPLSEDSAYIAKWGGFAAISPSRQLVANRPTSSVKVEGVSGDQFNSRDLVAYVNFAAFRSQASAGLAIGRMMATSQIDQAAQRDPQKARFVPVAKTAVAQVFNGLEHFVEDARAITFGIDLSAEGVSVAILTDFTPDSYLGKHVSQWKTPEMQVASGIPDGKYAIVGQIAWDSAKLIQLMDEAAGPVIQEAQKLGDEAKPVIGYIESVKDWFRVAAVQSIAISPAQGEIAQTGVFEVSGVTHGDSAKIISEQMRMTTLQNDFMKAIQVDSGAQSTDIKKAAKTIDGVVLDQITSKIDEEQADPTQLAMMRNFYGEGGLKGFLGAVNGKTVVFTTIQDDARLKTLVSAARAGNTPDAVQAANRKLAGKLPARPFFAYYIFPDQAMALVSRGSEAFAGTPIETALAPGGQPVGVTMSTDASAVRMDMFLPSPLLQSIISSGMKREVEKQQMKEEQGL